MFCCRFTFLPLLYFSHHFRFFLAALLFCRRFTLLLPPQFFLCRFTFLSLVYLIFAALVFSVAALVFPGALVFFLATLFCCHHLTFLLPLKQRSKHKVAKKQKQRENDKTATKKIWSGQVCTFWISVITFFTLSFCECFTFFFINGTFEIQKLSFYDVTSVFTNCF